MVNQQLLDYIKQQLQQGISKEQIRSSLMANGWQVQDIEEGFNALVSSTQPIVSSDTFSQQSFSSQPSKRINKKLITIISIIIGIAVIGVGGIFAYFNYFQSPEKIVQKMIVKMTEIKSLEYSGETKLQINDSYILHAIEQQTSTKDKSKDEGLTFLVNFTGSSDTLNPNDPKGQISFNIKTDTTAQEKFTFGLEIKVLNKIIYIKLGDIPNLGFFDLSSFSNQWIKIDPEAIKKQFEGQIKESQKQQELTPEQIEKLKQIVARTKIFKVTEKLTSEKINSINTHHYKFLIDKDELKKLILDISTVVQSKTPTQEELTGLDKGLKEIIEFIGGELWIGKKDYLLYKILLTIKIKETAESESKTEAESEAKAKITEQLTTTLSFKNFNKPVQIKIPEQAKPLEELLKEIGGLFEGLQGLTPGGASPFGNQDFNKDTDKDGLPDYLETTIYNTNPNKADTDGDGIKDGEEIEKSLNPNKSEKRK